MRLISSLFALVLIVSFAQVTTANSHDASQGSFLKNIDLLSWIGDFMGRVILSPSGGEDAGDGSGSEPSKLREVVCNDGQDNDNDGDIDCDDIDCNSDSACTGGGEICNDGIDNDFDGRTDCDDFDCVNDLLCGSGDVEICNDGIDNDGDSLTDCDDLIDCATDSVCNPDPEICNDNIDNDGDSFIDCADGDCDYYAACKSVSESGEICNDGIDNDLDGFTDCEDIFCYSNILCAQPSQGEGTGSEDSVGEVSVSSPPSDLGNVGEPESEGVALASPESFMKGFSGSSFGNSLSVFYMVLIIGAIILSILIFYFLKLYFNYLLHKIKSMK